MKKTDVNVEQEYLNQYTTGTDSIFGNIESKDKDQSTSEWD